MNLHYVLAREAEVVVVGINGRYDEALRDYEVADALDVQSFDSTYRAYQYLQAGAPGAADTCAVICDAEKLHREGYLFVHNLRRDPTLARLPVIAIDRSGEFASVDLLSTGIDDVYVAPVSWEVLTERIRQIAEYRRLLEEEVGGDAGADLTPAEDPFRIPAGKRAFDVAFALLALAFFAVPMLAIAAAIKLTTRGDVFYKSRRIGTGYEEFDFLKFCSMVPDADKLVDELREQNRYGAEGAFFKMANDPRVTPIGRIIRRTSLDELPQLINVLRGDMSIVGNRPLPLGEAETLTSEQWSERFLAPAGITGKWQTSGPTKDKMGTDERMALDIEYARTYSPLMDLQILFKTFGAMKQESNV